MPNPTAGPGVQVILNQTESGETADVYFSSILQQIDTSTGQITDATLPNDSSLSVSVAYAGDGSQPYSFSFNAGTTCPVPADSAPTVATLEYAPVTAMFEGQSTTTGTASIQLSGLPSGSTLSSATLSDVAGLEWGTPYSYGRPELGMSITSTPDSTVQTITFPPYRDEAGTTMTLTYQLTGNPTQYVTDIAVPSGDHTIRSSLIEPNSPYEFTYAYGTPLMLSPGGSPNMVTYTNSDNELVTVDLETLLSNAGNGIYNNFEFTSGTYDLDEVLDIQAPMILQGAPGSDAVLEFTFTSSTNVWDSNSNLLGAINIRSSHVWLENLSINFSQSSVTFGTYDNELGAVIDDQNSGQTACVDVNLEGLTIHAPFNSSDTDSNYWNNLDNNGYMAVQAIQMGDYDSGTIENNWIYGGTTGVKFGPWTISGNHYVGSVPGTICLGAFAVSNGHDVTIEDNTLTDPDPSEDGQLERLMTGSGGGFNIDIVDNTVSDNVGDLANIGNVLNAPEEILPEAYGLFYEGSSLASSVSSLRNGSDNLTVIAIPSSELFNEDAVATSTPGTSPVLYILDGSSAGTAIAVTQVFPSDSSTCFVLNSPLPQGTFDFSIASSFNVFTVSSNTIDTSGTVLTALVLASDMNDVQVTGNTFKGDQTTGPRNWYSGAIRISPDASFAGSNTLGAFNSNNSFGNFGVSLVAMAGVAISGNTFDNPISGIDLFEAMFSQPPSTYGRTYAFINLENNIFIYSYQNTSIIHMGDNILPGDELGYPNAYSDLVNGTTVVPAPDATYFVDPRQFSITASGNTVDWVGVSPPATDVQIDAAEVNGVLYDGDSYTTSTSPPLLRATSPFVQVDLSGAYNVDGITTDDDAMTGDLDGPNNSYSANLLGTTVNFNGLAYNIGPADTDDVVVGVGQSIPLPAGQYSSLDFLGADVNGEQPDLSFTVTYGDTSTTQVNQAVDDWTMDAGQTGESLALTMPYRNPNAGVPVYLYEYSIALDPAKTVDSITLPRGSQFVLLAMDLVSAGPATQLVIETQPSATATAGVAFATQPVIYEEDQYGNLETGDNSTVVTVSLNTGSGPLQGTTTAKVSGGVATFTNLADDTAETISLKFASGSLASATSNSIVVSRAYAPASSSRTRRRRATGSERTGATASMSSTTPAVPTPTRSPRASPSPRPVRRCIRGPTPRPRRRRWRSREEPAGSPPAGMPPPASRWTWTWPTASRTTWSCTSWTTMGVTPGASRSNSAMPVRGPC